MLGEPLNTIIPNPIKRVHSTFFNYDKTKGGGRMYMHKLKRGFVCLNKEGNIIKGNLTLRINICPSNSLQMVGVFNFPLDNQQICIAILDRYGKITAVTDSCGKVFDVGTKMSKYNTVFREVFDVILSRNCTRI